MTRVPLPPGQLGVTFSGSPPIVTDVVPDSPMRSKLSIGDVIYGVAVPHRFEVHGVEDSSILSELITKTANLRRFLLLSTTSHDYSHSQTEFHVTLPPGRLGLTFEGDTQPTIAKVWDYCPVREFVQEGQWLKSVIIPTEPEPIACQNLSARDVYEVLRVNDRCQGRVLVLTNPPLAVAEPVLASMCMDDSSFHTSRTHQSYHTAPSVASSNSVESSTTIDATIEQSVLTIQLRSRQRVRCDHECMIYMSEGFRIKTHGMNVRDFQKGYPLELTEFIYEGSPARQGTVALGCSSGCQILKINLDNHYGRVICQAEAYLCSEMSVKVYVESVSANGESMQIRLSGTGHVWLTGNGSIMTKTLIRGETLRCASGALVAFEKTVQPSPHRMRGGLRSAMSGERKDCSLTELAGPGTVWLQTSVCAGNQSFPTNALRSYQSSQGCRNGSRRVEL